MKQSIYFSLILSFLFSMNSYAQSFSLDLPYDTVYIGNTLTLTFIAKNIEGEIQVDLQGLPIVSGPNQSSSRMMMNGEIESSSTVSYVLAPKEAGYIEIPAAYLNTSDVVLETSPVSILVMKNPDHIIQEDKSKEGGFFFGNQFLKNSVPNTKPTIKKRKLKKI